MLTLLNPAALLKLPPVAVTAWPGLAVCALSCSVDPCADAVAATTKGRTTPTTQKSPILRLNCVSFSKMPRLLRGAYPARRAPQTLRERKF
jgi:hypothetical protein